MPTPMDAMMGLVIVAIGILTLVVAFQVGDFKKRLMSYLLSLLVVALGLGYFIKAEARSHRLERRISNIRTRTRTNLGDIKSRLQKSKSEKKEVTATAEKKKK